MSLAGQFADISSNNPLPDVHAYAAAGHKHLCRKVSEGTGYHWLDGDTVADQAHAAGLHVGHYHWLRPDQSATAQAAFFVTLVRPHLKPGDWLMTDFETTHGVSDPSDLLRAAQLEQFTAEVHRQLPTYPLYVYTGNWYLDGKPHCQAAVRRWLVVMSNYSPIGQLPNPHDLTYAAWQFTDRAHVAGFSSTVDYNRWLIMPTVSTGGFTMDKEVSAKFAEIEASLARIESRFIGSDGLPHAVESSVAHVTQGAGYLSKKGRRWTRLFRFGDKAAV